MEYRVGRTICGKKMLIRMDSEAIRERKIYWAVVVIMPLAAVWIFAKAAGMI